jgi:REP element-mobilizing transposase RayT
MKQDFFEPGVVYHVFNRGNNKENIFKEEKNYTYFLSLIEKYLFPVSEIYAFCLLKNHFHLALRIKDEEFLEDKYKTKTYLPFSNLFNAYTKAINKSYNRTGSLFQEHLHRKRVEDDDYLMQLIAYIHLNPVKHGFSNDFKSYPYSSYKYYLDLTGFGNLLGLKIFNGEYVMSLFGDVSNFEYWHNLNKLYLEDKMEDI